ncbi:hypothetical protein ANN_26405 [Periplaneta americana]|uniref:Uncharacterized protein n=1 Tax=Periplaneta americana TaxID=6978 RepID=A0ABQ8RY82_PERAM|nr:hypothetical protein ANN_26405 [Periplaneta americana]
MSPGSSTESYPAFAYIGLRENPGKNLNQVTCPDRESNPGHLVSQPDLLTVTPQVKELRARAAGIKELSLEITSHHRKTALDKSKPITELLVNNVTLKRVFRLLPSDSPDVFLYFDDWLINIHTNFQTLDTQGILLLQEKFTESPARESNPGPPDLEASMLTNRPRRHKLSPEDDLQSWEGNIHMHRTLRSIVRSSRQEGSGFRCWSPTTMLWHIHGDRLRVSAASEGRRRRDLKTKEDNRNDKERMRGKGSGENESEGKPPKNPHPGSLSQAGNQTPVRWVRERTRYHETTAVDPLEELKTRIREAAATVTEDMLKRVWEEFDYRLDICRVTRGSHIESL